MVSIQGLTCVNGTLSEAERCDCGGVRCGAGDLCLADESLCVENCKYRVDISERHRSSHGVVRALDPAGWPRTCVCGTGTQVCSKVKYKQILF